jgi:hypothetical protein
MQLHGVGDVYHRRPLRRGFSLRPLVDRRVPEVQGAGPVMLLRLDGADVCVVDEPGSEPPERCWIMRRRRMSSTRWAARSRIWRPRFTPPGRLLSVSDLRRRIREVGAALDSREGCPGCRHWPNITFADLARQAALRAELGVTPEPDPPGRSRYLDDPDHCHVCGRRNSWKLILAPSKSEPGQSRKGDLKGRRGAGQPLSLPLARPLSAWASGATPRSAKPSPRRR